MVPDGGVISGRRRSAGRSDPGPGTSAVQAPGLSPTSNTGRPKPMTGAGDLLSMVRRVCVHCPISASTFAELVRGDFDAALRDPASARLLKIIEDSYELGNFGTYRGVCELALGYEAFTPAAGARPVLGSEGKRSATPMLTITTFVPGDVPEVRLAALVADLAAAHPWELPVIEIATVQRFNRRP